jgi:hypothetical protein
MVTEPVVAVEVGLSDGQSRYFITWGRIQGAVAYGAVSDLVLRYAESCSLGGEIAYARVCYSLREAAESEQAPSFYECLLPFAQTTTPSDSGYESWRRARAAAMERGEEISYCGTPPDHETLMAEVRATLGVLAKPVAEQLAHLERMESSEVSDLLDLRTVYCPHRHLSATQRVAFGAAEQGVDRLTERRDLHTPQALAKSDEWAKLRALARTALDELTNPS